MKVATIVILLLLAPVSAIAGAWLRGEGETFAAVGLDALFGTGQRQAARGYVEYGWHRHLTIGADLYTSTQSSSHGLFFLRTDMFRRQSRLALSLSGALGARATATGPVPLYRLGVAAGLPFRKGPNAGWAGAELTLERQSGVSGLTRKIDATFGMTFSAQWQGLVDLGLTRDASGARYMEIAPRAAYRLDDHTRLVFGLKATRSGTSRSRGLTFDIWRDF